jgi:hypothetical protein
MTPHADVRAGGTCARRAGHKSTAPTSQRKRAATQRLTRLKAPHLDAPAPPPTLRTRPPPPPTRAQTATTQQAQPPPISSHVPRVAARADASVRPESERHRQRLCSSCSRLGCSERCVRAARWRRKRAKCTGKQTACILHVSSRATRRTLPRLLYAAAVSRVAAAQRHAAARDVHAERSRRAWRVHQARAARRRCDPRV